MNRQVYFNTFTTPNYFLEEVINMLNVEYEGRTQGDLCASIMGIFREYKSEIKTLFWARQSSRQVADFVSQFLILK